MINGMLGRKVGMTQIFAEDGSAIPVTVVRAGPMTVIQVKTEGKEGYDAVQCGFDPETRERKVNQPSKGHFGDQQPMKVLREFRVEKIGEVKPGQTFDLSVFQAGEKVDVMGISKGKGFQGVIKRHHFSSGPASHGSQFHRRPGSIGNRTFPGRVLPNKRMPGHMGDRRVTIKNLTIRKVIPEQNLLLIQGAIPSRTGAVVTILKPGFGKG
jgi:large subunit ribosomal protein L3